MSNPLNRVHLDGREHVARLHPRHRTPSLAIVIQWTWAILMVLTGTYAQLVESYRDEATGVMTEDGRGGGAFTEVVLRPRVVVAEASMIDAARAAHAQAHDWCFIANSVNFPVRHEAEVSAARGGAPA